VLDGPISDLKRRSLRYRGVTLAIMILFACALLHQGTGIFWAGAHPAELLDFLFDRAPLLVFLYAIWLIHQALRRIGQGEAFGQSLPRLLTRLGVALATGALLVVIGMPLAERLIRKGGALLNFDPSAIVLAAVGTCFILLADLVRASARMRSELDEIV
jgi:Protein of unknown function (DUF2975)